MSRIIQLNGEKGSLKWIQEVVNNKPLLLDNPIKKFIGADKKNNIEWQDIEENLVFPSLTVNELGMQIQAQALDAVIVWDAIARYYSDYGDEIPIPIENNVISTVDIGVLNFTKHKELAEKFVYFVTCEAGQRIFKKHNYSTEPPE